MSAITTMEAAVEAISKADTPTGLKDLIDAGFVHMEKVNMIREKSGDDKALSPEFDIPMLVYASVEELKVLRRNLSTLAKKGIVTAVDAQLF